MAAQTRASSKGAETRERILNAAIRQFAADGFRRTSIADVAEQSRVSAPTVHSYFGTKDELFAAACARDIDALVDTVEQQMAQGAGPTLRLIPGIIDLLGDHPLAARLLRGSEPDVAAQIMASPSLDRLRSAIAARVAEAQNLGIVQVDLPPATIALALETLLLSLTMLTLQLGGPLGRHSESQERRDAVMAVMIDGLRPRHPST
jgi:AcrR family transcriptional regulator